jgi:hypothetical protein
MTEPTDPVAARALGLLRARGAGEIRHPGGNLLAHLLRTHELLRGWGASEPLSLAGLCHAAYGTNGFGTALLALAERDQLRAIIGDEAERIVYVYCACARSDTYARLGEMPLRVADRFTGGAHVLRGDDAVDFALLTIANELDIVRAGNLAPTTLEAVRGLFAALSRHAPAAGARALEEIGSHG